MNKLIFGLLGLFFYCYTSYAQTDVNKYKYIIVPKNYEFLKGEDDRYKLNSLTLFLFNKYGFTAFFEDEEYPEDLLNNACLGAKVHVVENSKLFTTRLVIQLLDCYNKVVYSSIEGSTREKEFEKAYQAAIRGAFVSFQTMNYSFDPALSINLPPQVRNEEVNASINESESVDDSKSKETAVVPVMASESAVEESAMSNEVQKNELTDNPTSHNEVTPVPLVVAETNNPTEADNVEDSVLKSYKNDAISFFLIEQGEELHAYVNSSKDGSYKKGEKIASFSKTSIPNVYRVSWKDKDGNSKQTTGYFDDKGNLNVDINKNGNIEVLIFEVEE